MHVAHTVLRAFGVGCVDYQTDGMAPAPRRVDVGKPGRMSRWANGALANLRSLKALLSRHARAELSPAQRALDERQNLMNQCATELGHVAYGVHSNLQLKNPKFFLVNAMAISQQMSALFDSSPDMNTTVSDFVFELVEGLREAGGLDAKYAPDVKVDRIGDKLREKCFKAGLNPMPIVDPEGEPFRSYVKGVMRDFFNATTTENATEVFAKGLTNLLRHSNGSVDQTLKTRVDDVMRQLIALRRVPNPAAHQEIENALVSIIQSNGFLPYLITRTLMEATLSRGINFRMNVEKLDDGAAQRVKHDLIARGFINKNWEINEVLVPKPLASRPYSQLVNEVNNGLEQFIQRLKEKLNG